MSNSPLTHTDWNPPFNVRFIRKEAGFYDFTYETDFGYRRAAYLVAPEGDGPCAAALYVHWYEPWEPTSNRRQFLEEARLLAKRGVVSLLIETMWSDQDWFYKRTQADDIENSLRQVAELRQAADLVLSYPGVEQQRFAYIGHDFGAMYGVLFGGTDRRPSCYVLMAGTPSFADWYLYYPKVEGEARQAYCDQMRAYDPVQHVASLQPAPLMFQFGRQDPHVPDERAYMFYEAAGEPKETYWYDARHGLNETAAQERVDWLCKQLKLT